MITCDKKYLLARCQERGYSLPEVMPCVTNQNGDLWTIDETHPNFPHPRGERQPACASGAELKKLLSRIGIHAAPTCGCNARAAHMDYMGCDWVRANMDLVVGWLEEESQKRGLPFIRAAGRALVNLAIRRAEAKTQK